MHTHLIINNKTSEKETTRRKDGTLSQVQPNRSRKLDYNPSSSNSHFLGPLQSRKEGRRKEGSKQVSNPPGLEIGDRIQKAGIDTFSGVDRGAFSHDSKDGRASPFCLFSKDEGLVIANTTEESGKI
jgi:hypothetical protein